MTLSLSSVPWLEHLTVGSSNQHIISDSNIRADDTKKQSLIYPGKVAVVKELQPISGSSDSTIDSVPCVVGARMTSAGVCTQQSASVTSEGKFCSVILNTVLHCEDSKPGFPILSWGRFCMVLDIL